MTEVWKISKSDIPSLNSVNGIGFSLLGRTRPDEHGKYFATRWFTVFGLPLLPLGRYYVKLIDHAGSHPLRSVERYRFHGQSKIRPREVVRTYLFFYVTVPVLVIAPIVLVLKQKSTESLWVIFGMVVGYPLLAIILIVWLVDAFGKRFSPVPKVRWVKKPSHELIRMRGPEYEDEWDGLWPKPEK